jgi:hypothetical protein
MFKLRVGPAAREPCARVSGDGGGFPTPDRRSREEEFLPFAQNREMAAANCATNASRRHRTLVKVPDAAPDPSKFKGELL